MTVALFKAVTFTVELLAIILIELFALTSNPFIINVAVASLLAAPLVGARVTV
jgi:hypothetical protein